MDYCVVKSEVLFAFPGGISDLQTVVVKTPFGMRHCFNLVLSTTSGCLGSSRVGWQLLTGTTACTSGIEALAGVCVGLYWTILENSLPFCNYLTKNVSSSCCGDFEDFSCGVFADMPVTVFVTIYRNEVVHDFRTVVLLHFPNSTFSHEPLKPMQRIFLNQRAVASGGDWILFLDSKGTFSHFSTKQWEFRSCTLISSSTLIELKTVASLSNQMISSYFSRGSSVGRYESLKKLGWSYSILQLFLIQLSWNLSAYFSSNSTA